MFQEQGLVHVTYRSRSRKVRVGVKGRFFWVRSLNLGSHEEQSLELRSKNKRRWNRKQVLVSPLRGMKKNSKGGRIHLIVEKL